MYLILTLYDTMNEKSSMTKLVELPILSCKNWN